MDYAFKYAVLHAVSCTQNLVQIQMQYTKHKQCWCDRSVDLLHTSDWTQCVMMIRSHIIRDIFLLSFLSFFFITLQVIIQATVGDGIRGDIAIDDITFTPFCIASSSTLPTVPTTIPTKPPTLPPGCGPDEFTCDNGQCIPISARCDGKSSECSDSSDERNCGM